MDSVVRQPIGLSVIEVALFFTSLPGLFIYVEIAGSQGQPAPMLWVIVGILVVVAQWVMAWWLLDARLILVRRLLIIAGLAPLVITILGILLSSAMRTPANFFAVCYLAILGGVIPLYLYKSKAVRRFEQKVEFQ